MSVLILGAGAYGLALSHSLKCEVYVYSSLSKEIDLLNRTRKSKLFDVKFGSNIHFVSSIDFDYDLIILALPTSIIVSELSKLNLKDVPIIIASKGIVDDKFIYDIIDFLDNPKYVLSGPSFAKDMINNDNIVLTLAGCSELDIFNDNIKLEYTDDIVGVLVCGVVKNIFAIACGMLRGMGVSDSTFSAFLNLVINEAKCILSDLGDVNTIFLSCGLGDIILTCTCSNSRNYTFGYLIGSSSRKVDKYLSSNTVEGVSTLKSLKGRINNDLINLIYDIVFNNVDSIELLKYIVK